MNVHPSLTDDAIRVAIARRARSGTDLDLRERVLAATTATRQRRGWRVRLEQGLTLSDRRATYSLVALVVMLLALALGVALVGRLLEPTPGSLGKLAYIWQGDLYVAGPAGESPRLVWHDPAPEDSVGGQLNWLDPETVLIQSWATFSGGVHVINVTTGADRVLDAGTFVALSPDRRVVAIRTFEKGAKPETRVRLFDIASGSVVGELPEPISGYPARWSPDGRSIVGESPDTIYRVDVATGARTVLAVGLCCGLSPHVPTWSPDGMRVVYVNYHLPVSHADCDFRCGTLWSVPSAGGQSTRITPELGSEYGPAFSPDGRWIAYVNTCPCSDASTTGLVSDNLTIMATDGSGARVIAPDPRSQPTTDPAGYLTMPGLDRVPRGQFSWDPDSAGVTYVATVGTLWHVTLDGIAIQLEGSAITEFARQGVP